MPAHLDAPMNVPACHQTDMRMTGENFAKVRGALSSQTDVVHAPDACSERRVMHENHGRLARRSAELPVQPINLVTIQRPSRFPEHAGIERNQSQRMACDAISRRLTDGPKVSVIGKYLSHYVAIVVVSGNQIQGDPEGRQQLLQPPVFPLAARVDKISGRKYEIGERQLPHQMRNTSRERRGRVVAAVGETSFGAYVEIRDLRDDHHDEEARQRRGQRPVLPGFLVRAITFRT